MRQQADVDHCNQQFSVTKFFKKILFNFRAKIFVIEF